jgi:hypothetical protein
MMTKRVVEGGSTALAGGKLAQQSAPLAMAVALLGAASLACHLGSSGESSTTGDAIGVATPQGTDVVRYSGLEVIDTGTASIRQAVQARRAADWSSSLVATLYPGTQISRIARYGNFSLVSWAGSMGTQQGWVDTTVAFSLQRIDAGAAVVPAPVFGTPTATTPAATTTAPPAATTTTPPAATTTPPKTTTTAPTTPAPTATVTTPRTGFKPPKLK